MLAHVYPQKAKSFSCRVGLPLCVLFFGICAADSRRKLSDLSGGTIVDAQVTLAADATKRTRTQKTGSSGS
jgi:hypothetical protein